MLTDEEILFKLRNTPKNKWEELAKEFDFNLKKYIKLLEEEERRKREEIELVRNRLCRMWLKLIRQSEQLDNSVHLVSG